MKYRAVIEQSEGWWIGWLVDLPGLTAQDKTQAELLVAIDRAVTPVRWQKR